MKPAVWPAQPIERMRLALAISDRELCTAAKVTQETWRLARTANEVTWPTLRKLLDGLAATIGSPTEAPVFDITPLTMSLAERRALAREAEEEANNRRTAADVAHFKRLASQLRARPRVFTASAVAWLQYQWALEIGCRALDVSSGDVAALTPGKSGAKRQWPAARARAIALYLCVEVFGTPQHLLAFAARMTDTSVLQALRKVRSELRARDLSDFAITIAECASMLRRRATRFRKSG